jgi:hypothetical protein
MPLARRRFAVVFFAFGLSFFSGKATYSQVQSIGFLTSTYRPAVIPRPCRNLRPVPDTQWQKLLARGVAQPGNLCDELASDRSTAESMWRADPRDKADEDPVLEELKSLGAPGLTIALAREAVIEILEGHNRCAAWFEQSEPDAARKFRSLRYSIDESSPQYSLKIQNAAGEWLYQQPYVASSIEGAGASSTITINGKGAFFQLRAGVHVVPKDGGPTGLSAPQLLQIDHYVGGTLDAQITALLHEYSHVVGLLPADGEGFSGREASTQNTQIVLRYCRAQVEGAGKLKSVH